MPLIPIDQADALAAMRALRNAAQDNPTASGEWCDRLRRVADAIEDGCTPLLTIHVGREWSPWYPSPRDEAAGGGA